MKFGQWMWYKDFNHSKSFRSIKKSDKAEIPASGLRIFVGFGYVYASGLREGRCYLRF